MSEYGQFCPVSRAAEVFAERWTPLVIRELLSGSHRFNDLRRGVPIMSPTLLARRLRTLEAAGIIETRRSPDHQGREYFLTPAGEEFRPIIEALGVWGQRWAQTDASAAHRDPSLLVWDIHRRLDLPRFPPGRTVIAFLFPDAPRQKRAWWIVVNGEDVDVCLSDPGYDADLRITVPVDDLTAVWLGDRRLADAIRDRTIILEGPRALQQAFPTWLLLCSFADVERPRATTPARRAALPRQPRSKL